MLNALQFSQRFPAPLRAEKDAWRELAALWNMAPGDGEPCAELQRQQLHCFRGPGSTLAQIRQLGRPGIVTLHDESGRPMYALLTGLGTQAATLRMGSASQTVSLTTLAQLWQGDFATLWRAPAGYHNRIVDGSSGPAVDRLATQLAVLRGEAPPVVSQAYNERLRAAVRAFQRAQGLTADGVAGPTTFMQLNRATGVEEPRLQIDPIAD